VQTLLPKAPGLSFCCPSHPARFLGAGRSREVDIEVNVVAVGFGRRPFSCTPMREAVMGTRENSIATWCKRFQIDLWKLRDRMKAGELTVYEKRADGEVDITPAAMVKLKELITEIEGALLDE
jgi:hypothetical protein